MKTGRDTCYIEYLRHRTFIGVICLGITFTFLSGQMWNQIRRPPFSAFNQQTRETKYIHRSPKRQYLSESYVIFASYAAITIGFILINEFRPSKTEKAKKKKISTSKPLFYINKKALLCYFGLVLSVAFFLLMSSMLCSKNRKYSYCVAPF